MCRSHRQCRAGNWPPRRHRAEGALAMRMSLRACPCARRALPPGSLHTSSAVVFTSTCHCYRETFRSGLGATSRREMAKRIVKKTEKKERGVKWLPDLKPGKYADGLPLNEIQYLECKLILRPNHFTSRKSFFDFAKIMRRPAAETKVEFSSEDFVDAPLQIREVLFVDTADYRFYNNAFILRRRVPYEDGFPVGDPEIVFKFRHPDIQTAAQTDVRPQIFGDYRIKFKAEALPLKDQLGGIRILFSHNV